MHAVAELEEAGVSKAFSSFMRAADALSIARTSVLFSKDRERAPLLEKYEALCSKRKKLAFDYEAEKRAGGGKSAATLKVKVNELNKEIMALKSELVELEEDALAASQKFRKAVEGMNSEARRLCVALNRSELSEVISQIPFSASKKVARHFSSASFAFSDGFGRVSGSKPNALAGFSSGELSLLKVNGKGGYRVCLKAQEGALAVASVSEANSAGDETKVLFPVQTLRFSKA